MKKLIAFLLCTLLAVMPLAACDGGGDTSSAPADLSDVTSQTEDSDQSADVSEEVSEAINYLERIYTGDDYVGRTFTVLTSEAVAEKKSEMVYNENLTDSDDMPETVNEAIKRRNDSVEELLGVTIQEIRVHDPSRYGGVTLDRIINSTLGSGENFNAVLVCLYDCGSLALNGYLHDLAALENLDLTNPWWEQTFNESADIAGSQYFLLGDMLIGYKGSLPCIYYNKSLFESLGLEDPQQLVMENRWTLDKLIELVSSYSQDINGTPGIQYDDCYGWAGQYDDMYYMLYGSGVRILSQDADGYPYFSLWSERANNVVEKTLDFMLDADHYVSANDLFSKFQWPTKALEANFVAGNTLFCTGQTATAVILSQMEDAFAIAPIPKYDAEQDEYYSLLNTWTTNALAIPTNNSEEDAEFAAAVLEAMGYYSWEGHADSVAVAYLERVIKMQKLQGDETSLKILDIIFDTAGMEMGAVFQIGKISGSKNVNEVLSDLISGKKKGQFRSSFEAYEEIFEADTNTVAQFFKSRG